MKIYVDSFTHLKLDKSIFAKYKNWLIIIGKEYVHVFTSVHKSHFKKIYKQMRN